MEDLGTSAKSLPWIPSELELFMEDLGTSAKSLPWIPSELELFMEDLWIRDWCVEVSPVYTVSSFEYRNVEKFLPEWCLVEMVRNYILNTIKG